MFDILQRELSPAKGLNLSSGGKTEPAKRLSWMIANPPEVPIKMTITPELAAEMLTYNTDNRPVSSGSVNHYAEQMKAGEWRDTFMPIQFSDKGRLIDGQHRLQAILDSGCAVAAWVAFGADDETFAFIDIGKKRTAGDIFAINGVKNCNVVAAACRWIFGYENDRSFHTEKGASGGARYRQTTDPDPLYRFYMSLDTERLQDSTKVSRWFIQHGLPNPSVAAAIHYVCAGKSRAAADEYFEKLATGIGFLNKSDPAYKVREELQGAINRSEQACFTIEGWNALRRNRRLGRLAFSGGKLPRVA
jgi:hypothetical protein